jgi:hypothetical protein
MEPDLEPAIAEMSRPVTARAALSISGTPKQPSQKIRFAAIKPKSTEPDVSAVTIMLSTPPRAVDSTIRKRAAGTATCFDRAALDFVCFFAGIYHL